MDTMNQYGGEGERLVLKNDRTTLRRESDRVPRSGITAPTAFLALALQGVGIIVSLGWGIRSVEMTLLSKVDEVKGIAKAADAHAQSAIKDLEHHVDLDHVEKDRARLLLHNSCAGAQNRGCHPAVKMNNGSESWKR